MMSSIQRGEWYANSVCHAAERRMLCGHGLSVILNLSIELLKIDYYAFNSGNVTIHCVPALVQLFHLQLYYLTGFSPGHGRQTVWNGYNGKK